MDEQYYHARQGTPLILLRRMERCLQHALKAVAPDCKYPGNRRAFAVEAAAIKKLLRRMREEPERLDRLDSMVDACERYDQHFGGSLWVEVKCIVAQWRTWYEDKERPGHEQ